MFKIKCTVYKSIFDSLQDLIVVVNEDGAIMYANSSWHEYLLKIDVAHCNRESYYSIASECLAKCLDFEEKISKCVKSAIFKCSSKSMVQCLYCKDGIKNWFSIRIFPVYFSPCVVGAIISHTRIS